MNSPERPQPAITWDMIIEQTMYELEPERLESMTREELDQELREAGFDPEEEARRAQEFLDKLEHGKL